MDRDGTILNERGYLADPRDMKFYSSAFRGLKYLQKTGLTLFIVTNQSGVARGYFSIRQLQKVNEAFKRAVARHGIQIREIYFCPHMPTAGCACRKPKPGLIKRAVRQYKINPKASYVIGDQERDVQLASNVGAMGILVLTGSKKKRMRGVVQTCAHKVSKNLETAGRWIYNRELKLNA